MNIIHTHWLNFAKLIPESVSESVVEKLKHSFYAGAVSILAIEHELKDYSDMIPNQIIQSLYEQLSNYAIELTEC